MGNDNGLATAAMWLGIVSICISICAPVALILGIIALMQINKTGQGGKGKAIAGIVLGAIFSAGMIIGLIFQLATLGL